LGPVFFPSQRSFGHRTIQGQPAPVDLVQRLQRQQPHAPELLEHSGLRPLLKAPVRRAARADARRIERIPLRPGAQHKDNGIHRRAVAHARVVAPQRMRLARRQQRLHLVPEFIGQPPAIVRFDQAHDLSLLFHQETLTQIDRNLSP
jgi:hypothetical protein